MTRFYRLASDNAVLIVRVEPDGAAAASGLRDGDIILELGGQIVTGVDDLHRLLTEERIDRAVPITLLRGTERMTVDIVPRG